ncbi:MAG TPA: tetratricopeptide repeat protein [Gemmatimonadaceae bacterium]|jgi:TolA-binding protein|nr:tetratricopeptide repeat protein [Gemmatimonadaceae bacterium]
MRLHPSLRIIAPVAAFAATGCLATQGSIQTLQEEIRASRSTLSQSDSAILRAEDARRREIAALAATVERLNDSVKVLSTKLAQFQANAAGQFDAMGQQVIKIQAILGQNTRDLQEARTQLRAVAEQGGTGGGGGGASAPAPAPTPGSNPDTTQRAPNGMPGPATMFTSAIEEYRKGNYRTARSGFEDLIKNYPDFDQNAHAQLYIGDAFKAEGNTAAADSVYQLVETRYANSPDVAGALWRRGKMLWDANKKGEARIVLNRLITKYPQSDEAALAKDLLSPSE